MGEDMGEGSAVRFRSGPEGARAVRFTCFDTIIDLQVYPSCGKQGERLPRVGSGKRSFHIDPDCRAVARDRASCCGSVVPDDAAALDDALTTCVARCRRFERLLSRTDPSSDISRAHAASPDPVPVAPETAELVRLALPYCAGSRGCFDITMGTVTSLWDFHAGIVPSRRALADALEHVGVEAVEASPADVVAPWLAIRDPKAVLDLGGIAKGYIADDLAGILAACGIDRMALNLGGNVVVRGSAPGAALAAENAAGCKNDASCGEQRAPDGACGNPMPWHIGIADPLHPGRHCAVVELDAGSVVTSGTRERRFSRGGVTYHHILDPRTGMPAVTDAASATVVAERSLDCDGWSTTVLMLGAQGGIDFAEGVSGIEALTVDECGRVRWTSGLAGRVAVG